MRNSAFRGEERRKKKGEVFHVDKRVGGKLVEKCVPRSENMRKIVKQIRVLDFGESSGRGCSKC